MNIVNKVDPDIVLVNIEEGDREFISKILLKIDSLNPIVVGINVYFTGSKTPGEDSALANALRKINNDILIYRAVQENYYLRSEPMFTQYATSEGLINYEYTLRLISNMTPLQGIGNTIHESFAYKIVRQWHPGFRPAVKENEQIPINYQRTLKQYLQLGGSFLLETSIDKFDLKDKIFLVGYIGPNREDKYRTPLRFVGEEPEDDEPDTHGLVILANQIRTLLEYKR